MNKLINLQCTNCSNNLIGENNSKVFFCKNCTICFDIEKNRLKKYPVSYIKPYKSKNFTQILFPFWKIETEYEILNQQGNSKSSNNKIFYIPAFFIKNINNFGDIGYYYMQRNVVLFEDEKKDFPIFPADRGLKDAVVYPLIYLYKKNARKLRADEFIEIELKHKAFSMVLIPFYKIKYEYLDSILFWKYPSGALI